MPDLVVHAFTDGRDTLPTAGAGYLETRRGLVRARPATRAVGTVVGRYFAMDRDQRWDRMQRAYDLLVHGRGEHHADARRRRRCAPPTSATRPTSSSPPTTVGDEARDPARRHACIAFNFRPDRMREITRALAEPGFAEVDRGGAAPVERYADADRVRGGLALPGRVPARAPGGHAAAASSPRAGGRQLHVAETEKYPHVTYFFGGGEEDPEPGERRELVPSPRDVPTYDHKPADERARGGRRRSRGAWREDEPSASGSSTSPTPTWSATPA